MKSICNKTFALSRSLNTHRFLGGYRPGELQSGSTTKTALTTLIHNDIITVYFF